MPRDLDDRALHLGHDRAVRQRRSGGGDLAHLRGRQRVEDVGQPAAVDGVAQLVVDRPHAVGHRPVDRLHERGLAHLAGHRRERRAGQRRGDHPGDQQHRGRGDHRTGDRVDHLGRLPGDPCAQRPAGRTGQDLAEQRPGQDDDQRGEHPGDARPVDPVGDRPGQLGAEDRPAEEAQDGGGRDQQPLPEAGEGEQQRERDQHQVDEGHRPSAPDRHRADLPELRRGSCTRRGSRPAS